MGSLGRDHGSALRDCDTVNIRDDLQELFSENITAKILRTAEKHLIKNNPPTEYPEVTPQDGDLPGHYKSRHISFWTCGFFPGCIYSLIERTIKYPSSIAPKGLDLSTLRRKLEFVGRTWSDPIHEEAFLTNTHDLGFIILPHMRPRWELYNDEAALQTIITAAKSLHSRFNPTVGAIRSWDALDWEKPPMSPINGMDDNFIVIIDSLCNLDLLFYAAAHSGLSHLADSALSHARTLMKSHIRPEPSLTRSGAPGILYSTGHVVNFDPASGDVKEKRTAQGFSRDSTWSRGQAWAILGYAQTYVWTKELQFLDLACGLAEYFLLRMEMAPDCVEIFRDGSPRPIVGRYVPLWDFDAPIEGDSPLRDSSAGTIAANGMLILAKTLLALGNTHLASRYLNAAVRMVQDVLDYSLAMEKAALSVGADGQYAGVDAVPGFTFESILKNATVSNNSNGHVQVRDHGLIYADYYLIDFGTKLLSLGL